MKNNDTGEYELVVGNAQLLSVFVIVVLLCTAAFVMGYEVGQNTPRSAKAQADTSAPVSAPAPADSRPAQAAAPPPTETSPTLPSDANAPAGDAAKPVEPPPQPTTQPARETSAAAGAAPPVREAPAAAALTPGSYCQAMAAAHASDAQSLLKPSRTAACPPASKPARTDWCA